MDPMLLRAFQGQVEFQLRAVLDAYARLGAALAADQDMYAIWFAVESLLGAAANVSKALWGQGAATRAVRAPLRESVGVQDDSPFSDRKMRNHFEHYDERLDEWWEKSPRHNMVTMAVGPAGQTVVGLEQIDMFRQLDPATMEVIFWGDRFDINEIVAEASRLLPVVAKEAAKPHWES